MIWVFFLLIRTHVCPEPCQTSKRGNFAKIVNDWKPSIIIAKLSILDVWQGSPLKLYKTRKALFFTQHCVKIVHIRSYSGAYSPAFGLNTERYGVSLRIQSKCGKMWTGITPNTDTFHVVQNSSRYVASLVPGKLIISQLWKSHWKGIMSLRFLHKNPKARCVIIY